METLCAIAQFGEPCRANVIPVEETPVALPMALNVTDVTPCVIRLYHEKNMEYGYGCSRERRTEEMDEERRRGHSALH